MQDFDFRQIAPRCGSLSQSFEELCCQLAHRSWSRNDTTFTRLEGAGGDGGVECYVDLPDGTRIGWQAKYVFDIESLIKQATSSLDTALKIHKTLTKYIICFPFDLTGPTGRRGQSGEEKLEKWCRKKELEAFKSGRALNIEPWPKYKLIALILDLDTSGGVREFFFNKTMLSEEWFSNHLQKVTKIAGSRYTEELNIQTNLGKWFSAFGRTRNWLKIFEEQLQLCHKINKHFNSQIKISHSHSRESEWQPELRTNAASLLTESVEVIEEVSKLTTINSEDLYKSCCSRLRRLLKNLASLEFGLADELEKKYGQNYHSAGFKQWMAEYNMSFPTSNLDCVRDVINTYQKLSDWLSSPEGFLAFSKAFILTGVAGSGKTHGVCDVAHYRFTNNLLTCIVFGHQFGGKPEPWIRILEIFGLSITLGMNGLLDAMNAAAEASNSLMFLCIDAVNETRPLNYWKKHLISITHEIEKRPCLRLLITCRTTFIPSILPEELTYPILNHNGFAGIEHNACIAFFKHYNFEPPIAPILQPELKNPLYLKLVCDTLKINKLTKLPVGWQSLSVIIREFLKAKEKQFSEEYGVSCGANIIRGSLGIIAQTIAKSGNSALNWSQAQSIIDSIPQTRNLQVLEWLVRADLLIEDAPITETQNLFGDESLVRPSFERLGDFLIANEILKGILELQLYELFQVSKPLYYLVQNSASIAQNNGIINALSIIIPEKFSNIELPNLIDDELIRNEVLKLTTMSFIWRDPNSFYENSKLLLREALVADGNTFVVAMNAALSICWQPSAIDSFWLSDFLMQFSLSQRDAAWCGFLHEQYELSNSLKRLIDAAFNLPLNQLNLDVLERWSVMLLWFTAASDRRVKDTATRAVSEILKVKSEIIPNVLSRFILSNDDEVRERTLLSCYGALIVSQNLHSLKQTIIIIYESFQKFPECFDNALLRDHIRCIAELAQELGVLPEGYDLAFTLQPIGSDWPLQFPSDEEIKSWDNMEKFPKLVDSCLKDDFFFYSMSCLSKWEHTVDRNEMGRWILQQIIKNFGYAEFGCNTFDRYMLSKYGGGRSRQGWAERIGKKYQWIAMYQLASRLSDHVERKQDSWEPEPLRTPLILLDERKLDPTLPSSVVQNKSDTGVWWVKPQLEPQKSSHLSDTEWVKSQDDLPTIEDLLEIIEHKSQKWRLLNSYPTWGSRDINDENKPYRQIWIFLRSYLIRDGNFEDLYNCLYKRNFWGRWMPEGSSWLYGFLGEYPWGTSFNTEPDSWYAEGKHDFSNLYTSSCNQITIEWSDDASLHQPFQMSIPARVFFEPSKLWWNGYDGYRTVDGKTVFRDPSITEIGPQSLLADHNELLERLDSLGLRMMWTLLGEKQILGGQSDLQLGTRRTFSQIARLEKNGSIISGERAFFDDYTQDTGLLIENEEIND